MNLLRELDTFCAEKWVLRTLGNEQANTKLKQLYQLFHAGELTEDEMAATLYGADKTATFAPYKTLKTRLKEIYLNAVLLKEPSIPSYKTYDEAYRHGYRLLAVVRVLTSMGQFDIARKITEETFKQIRQFEIINLNRDLTDLLASMYLGSHFNKNKYLIYEGLNRYYNRAAYDLSLVSSFYREFRQETLSEKISPIETGLKATNYIKKSLNIRKKYQNIPKIQSMLIVIEVTAYMQRGEHEKAIKASLNGSQILKKLKGVSKYNLSFLEITRLECIIKLKDFQLGKKQIIITEQHSNISLINDLAIKRMAVMLGVSTSHYGFAYKYFSKTSHQELKQILPTVDFQSWLLLEAYLNLLIQAKQLIVQDTWPKLRRFRLGSFLNSVGDLVQNKRGHNQQVLIIRFLFYLVQGKQSLLIDQADSLKTYASRYLRGPENIRNRSFFRLMDIIVQTNFNRLATLKKSKATIQKIKDNEGKPGLNDTEIVPYETLWRIALEQLEVKKRDEKELFALQSGPKPKF